MPLRLLALLFCCPTTGTTRKHSGGNSTVIPNESSRLLQQPSTRSSLPALVVDRPKLQDKLGSIVRAKKGKMVHVGARTPFTIQTSIPISASAESIPPTSGESIILNSTPDDHLTPRRPLVGNRPPVLTLTSASSQGSIHRYSRSQHSSSGGSRSSSRDPERPLKPNASSAIGLAYGPRREGIRGNSELSGEAVLDRSVDKPPVQVAVQSTFSLAAARPEARSITFSWDDV
ncbi:hypothetical protein C8R47DRAFT_1110959 [Mycena vitilis]|nr:hypothetical protein C8R47DRAFT_1110959 [Mycena vitilis]